MTELPSTKFRATFQRLTELTVVTVNGHPIGTWTPGAPRRAPDADVEPGPIQSTASSRAYARELEDEIARLKRELAKRPAVVAETSFVNAVAGPATATPRGVHSPRQRVIDEALRKIGTKKR